MDFEVTIRYQEEYLPTPRCRKIRKREAQESLVVSVVEVDTSDAPIAFLVKNSCHDDSRVDYRLYNDKLWKPADAHSYNACEYGALTIDGLAIHLRYYNNDYGWRETRDDALAKKNNRASNFIIVDGVVYTRASEPRYVVVTFGLGHNHGGTSLMIDNWYNSNISKNCYFNALQREEAIAEAKRRAINRGDTESVDRIGMSYDIEVLIPSAVHCNPQTEHGDGDSFINSLESIIDNTETASEAALLSVLFTAAENGRVRRKKV